jgi:hypothetical protein
VRKSLVLGEGGVPTPREQGVALSLVCHLGDLPL